MYTRVQVRAFIIRDLYVLYITLYIYIYISRSAASLGTLEPRKGIAFQCEYTKLAHAISSITSIYRCYLRGKRSISDALIPRLITPS